MIISVLKHHVNKKIDNTCVLSILFVLVGLAGLEPVRVSSLDPKSNASTSSAIGPALVDYKQALLIFKVISTLLGFLGS